MIQNIGTDREGISLVLAALNEHEHAALTRILRLAEEHLDEIPAPMVGSRRTLAEAMIKTLREVHGIKAPARAAACTGHGRDEPEGVAK